MRFAVLAASLVALSSDPCVVITPPVRSIHSLAPDSTLPCEEALRGVWLRAGVKDSQVVWFIAPEDNDCEGSSLMLWVIDTSVAAIVTDSARSSILTLDPDSALKARLKKDKKLRKQFVHDTVILSRTGLDSMKSYVISTFRDASALYIDIALENPPEGILGGDYIETHWLWRADTSADTLRLIPFSNPWLTTAMDSGRISASAVQDAGGYLLTGNGDQLRHLLQVVRSDTAAFPTEAGTIFTRWHNRNVTARR